MWNFPHFKFFDRFPNSNYILAFLRPSASGVLFLKTVGLFMSIIMGFSEAAPGLCHDAYGGDGLAVGGQHPGLLLRHHQVVAGGSLQLLLRALRHRGRLLATKIMLLKLYCEM